MLDTLHSVHTPEGVDLNLRVAGPVARAWAFLIDFLLTVALMVAINIVLRVLGTFGFGLTLLAFFVISWFYPVFFELAARGQTPGKRLLGLRVVHRDGTPVTAPASVLRNFLRAVDLLPIAYLVGLVTMLLDSSFRRLGDLAAGTVVIYADPVRDPAGDVPEAAPLAPPVPLALEEQRAVIAFAERAAFLTPERAAELASIAAPLTGERDAQAALGRMAAWLVGRHR